MIYQSGKHKNVLKTGTARIAVMAELGEPLKSTIIPVGSVTGGSEPSTKKARVDTYLTKEVIADWNLSSGAGMLGSMTYGLSELIAVPGALGHFVPRQKALTIRYNDKDLLSRYFLNYDPPSQ